MGTCDVPYDSAKSSFIACELIQLIMNITKRLHVHISNKLFSLVVLDFGWKPGARSLSINYLMGSSKRTFLKGSYYKVMAYRKKCSLLLESLF